MNKKRKHILIPLLVVPIIASFFCGKDIISTIADNYDTYHCYMPKGETEIRDIVVSDHSHDGNFYKTRGTITSISYSDDGAYARATLQRTNGEDGSKSAILLYGFDGSLMSSYSVGNVVDVSGRYKNYNGLSELVYDSESVIELVSETNPDPVETLSLKVDDFVNSTFTIQDVNRLVTIQNVKANAQVEETITNFYSSIYGNDALIDIDDGITMSVKFSSYNITKTAELCSYFNKQNSESTTFDITGYMTYFSGSDEYALMVIDKDDIDVNIKPTGIQSIDIYTVNDFHGEVEESNSSTGLGKFATYFKEKGEEENTLIIDSGDTWQGSIYSNENSGKMITDVMNYAKFDARTVGNHDFDWGIDKLKENAKRKYNGYGTPTLAANVYDYDFDTREVGTVQRDDIGKKYVIRKLENGLKVGIIGTIGASQISSITTSNVKDIAFIDEIAVTKELATELREEEKCDVVIASCHSGQAALLGNDLSSYVDCVLCAHTHKKEMSKEEQTIYIQAGSSGQAYGHVSLSYNADTKSVVSSSANIINASTIKASTVVDENIAKIIKSYTDEVEEYANEVLASNVSGYFDRYEELPNLMNEAIVDYAKYNGQEVDFSCTNEARAYLDETNQFTYKDIFKAFPFDNDIYIIEATGKELEKELKSYLYFCRNESLTESISRSKKYRVAVIDYIAFHTNAKRVYDYFPQNAGNYVYKFDINWRLILKEYLKSSGYNAGRSLSSADYASDNWKFDASQLVFVN